MEATELEVEATTPRGWATTRENVLQAGLQLIGIGAVYVIIVVFFSLATEHFFTYSNAINILTNVTVIGIVALGQALAIISGGFDLSVSGVVPLGAVSFALLVNDGMPTLPAILLVLCVGAVVGTINGLIVTVIGINPLITTLGTLSITSGLAYSLSDGVTIPFENPDAGVLADKTAGDISYYVILLVALSIDRLSDAALLRLRAHALRHRRQPRGQPAGRYAREPGHRPGLRALLVAGRAGRGDRRQPVAGRLGDGR